MDQAAMNGHLDVVTWLHEHRNEGCTVKATDEAARFGHFVIIRFLHEKRAESGSVRAQRNAVRNSHLDIARYLLESNINVQPYDVSVEEQRKSRQEVSTEASTTTTIECVDFEKLGDLEIHEYCITNLIDIAAAYGHLDFVKYLYSRGEQCTSAGMSFAAMRGHISVCEWNSENSNENSTVSCDSRAADIAAGRGYLEVVRFLHENNISEFSARTLDCAAEWGHLDVVKFLHFNRSEGCTMAAMDMAARNGHLDVIKWLHANRSEGCTLEAINDADQGRFVEVIEWLRAHYPVEYEAWTTRGRRYVFVYPHLSSLSIAEDW